MKSHFEGIFRGMPVLVTGHTGFKGSWLSIWLRELGADVVGYSLAPPTDPANFDASRLSQRVVDRRGDVRDAESLRKVVEEFRPRVVFHLAAQAIVRASYANPKETFDTNVGGTVNVLEAIRRSDSVRAAVCITSDKCYENREWVWGYRENDRLGGRDPYSASKAMAEVAISAYRRSFFPADEYERHGVAIASARAGNVIGGGDWGRDRLVPDCARALVAGEAIRVRYPDYVRPWQFVLESLSGYLWLAVKLLREGGKFASAWNFGPSDPRAVSVRELVQRFIELWGAGTWEDVSLEEAPHEAGLLTLSWEKAARLLDWRPVYTWDGALAETVDWFRRYHEGDAGADMYGVCVEQIQRYADRGRELGLPWAG